MDKQSLEKIKESFEDRFRSLRNDFKRAYYEISNLQTSPFPIIMYSLSRLDYFSSLWAGWNETSKRGSDNRTQTQRMVGFMVKFLNYPVFESGLVVNIFRHKLMHTSEPRILNKKTGEIYSWVVSPKQNSHMKTIIVHNIHFLNFGVGNFIDDLYNAIFDNSKGYFSQLSHDVNLQKKYIQCINELNTYSL
ncbi:hypothetical protein HY612_02025 [Candidatus Roizmanbacteria bacterium]|nr:hypothetical protein [Candidatus Roizmanbacteria bacterium]